MYLLTEEEITQLKHAIGRYFANAPNQSPFNSPTSKTLADWIGQDEKTVNYLAFLLSGGRRLHNIELNGIRIQLQCGVKTEFNVPPTVNVRVDTQERSPGTPNPMSVGRPDTKIVGGEWRWMRTT